MPRHNTHDAVSQAGETSSYPERDQGRSIENQENDSIEKSGNTRSKDTEKPKRKSRGVLVHPGIYKAIQAYALNCDVNDYEVVDAAFAEYLQRRGLLPSDVMSIVTELNAKGLLQNLNGN